ncbi:hypothetical protein KP509_22G030900 [Ceratopteris richardii]|uniref:Uncharacterized protein n=1 Tax=Ceratopteris richardii TaxID=49495 RepID=A0A8T2S4R8_CERRI|nr:hypothetical protein KP509_22G030900 [Ceratopteris richardii]
MDIGSQDLQVVAMFILIALVVSDEMAPGMSFGGKGGWVAGPSGHFDRKERPFIDCFTDRERFNEKSLNENQSSDGRS